jgi:hypothetical protein
VCRAVIELMQMPKRVQVLLESGRLNLDKLDILLSKKAFIAESIGVPADSLQLKIHLCFQCVPIWTL